MRKEQTIVSFEQPFGYTELVRDLDRIKDAFPFLHVQTIGQSVMGKEIYAIRLGQAEQSVFVNGAFHANEWITSPIALRFVEEAARALHTGESFHGCDPASLFRQVELWTVPMVNPDGVELSLRGVASDHPCAERLLRWNGGNRDFSGWKANIRGVDLNDQFPANWEVERSRREVEGPGPRDYTGEAPLTEPEAEAIAAFTEAKRFASVLALHTQGQEIYWNYRGEEPPESERIARAMEAASGYKAIKLTSSDAGYKDWFIHRFRRPGFTVEAGFGTNPLPISQLPGMYEEVSAIVMQALLASVESN
jgi:g-D-glutamyl-meso-diaminopimelate peptidase